MSPRTVAILAFDDMEVLDFAGPYEVFNVAGELGEDHPFSVFSVGLTGALLLAQAGLLERRPATTHHDAYDELAAISPTTQVVRGQRFVRSAETILTSAGVSAGVDFALHVVQLLAGQATRDVTVTEMEWM